MGQASCYPLPMKAMVLIKTKTPLKFSDVPDPHPNPDQILVKISACAVCRTDLHVVDGDLSSPKLPLIPGHEIIGQVVQAGKKIDRFNPGDRVGIPWLGWSCGDCPTCQSGRENLCDKARFTGYQMDGGYAEYAIADGRFCFKLPQEYSDTEAAPLLCAGLIGYRSYKKTGEAKRLGLYGFGASASIITQVAHYQKRKVFAFTRKGDDEGQKFARRLGAFWVGDSSTKPPEELDAAIIFAPVGPLVPEALKHIAKGGIVVCAGIHMSDIPSFPYKILWGERTVCSVANLTRKDGEEFLKIAPKIPVRTQFETFPLKNANEALAKVRDGTIKGAAVLVID